MLDAYLEVLCEKTAAAEAFDALVEDYMKLPNEELVGLANGTSKLAYGDHDGEWLEKFEGTELYDDALQLEQQCLEVDIADQQHRLEQEMKEPEERPDFYKQKDAIRLKKRILDLELTKQKLSAGGDGEDDDEEEELPEAMEPSEGSGEPNPLGELKEAMAKEAGITPEVIEKMRKEAFGAMAAQAGKGLLAAGKGLAGFGKGAVKNVASATRSGGVGAGANMAKSVGKDGARMAAGYARKNPLMAAGMAGGAGLGAGYAAG